MKGLRDISLFIAVFIFTLHSIIPHFHESELSNEGHQKVHQDEKSSLLELISFYFHETTEEGQLDQVTVSHTAEVSQEVGFSLPLDFSVAVLSLNFELDCFYDNTYSEFQINQHCSNPAVYIFSSRPPPMVLNT